MKKQLLVLGAGGHAKVLISCLLLSKIEIVGILDNEASKIGQAVLGVEVIGNDDLALKYARDKVELVNGVGSIKSTALRQKIFGFFKNRGYNFAGVIHPTAIIAPDVKSGEGIQVMAGAIIQPGAHLGDNVIINTKASIDHDCFIAANVHIAPGTVLSGDVQVGEGTHVGTGAIVKQGIKIGRGCVIGAGALVLKDVLDNTTVVGVPARIISR